MLIDDTAAVTLHSFTQVTNLVVGSQRAVGCFAINKYNEVLYDFSGQKNWMR